MSWAQVAPRYLTAMKALATKPARNLPSKKPFQQNFYADTCRSEPAPMNLRALRGCQAPSVIADDHREHACSYRVLLIYPI